MDHKHLRQVIDWAKGTDLVELSWKDASSRVDFRIEHPSAQPAAAFPASALIPVPAPGVGVFRWSAKGSPRGAEEGGTVSAGDLLGLIETAETPLEVRAPSGGRLLKILIDDGKVVEYGQALFILHP